MNYRKGRLECLPRYAAPLPKQDSRRRNNRRESILGSHVRSAAIICLAGEMNSWWEGQNRKHKKPKRRPGRLLFHQRHSRNFRSPRTNIQGAAFAPSAAKTRIPSGSEASKETGENLIEPVSEKKIPSAYHGYWITRWLLQRIWLPEILMQRGQTRSMYRILRT